MKKLIEIPEKIDNILKKYKKKTGVPISAYIQHAIFKQMIHDGLIMIKRVTINVNKDNNKVVD